MSTNCSLRPQIMCVIIIIVRDEREREIIRDMILNRKSTERGKIAYKLPLIAYKLSRIVS